MLHGAGLRWTDVCACACNVSRLAGTDGSTLSPAPAPVPSPRPWPQLDSGTIKGSVVNNIATFLGACLAAVVVAVRACVGLARHQLILLVISCHPPPWGCAHSSSPLCA